MKSRVGDKLGQINDVAVIACHFAHRSADELAENADILVLQFINDWELLSKCVARRAASRVTVFEANEIIRDEGADRIIRDAFPSGFV